MADDRLGFEALRPVIESQMAFVQGALKFNVAVMQAWLGTKFAADTDDEGPSEACRKAEFFSP